MSYEEDYREPYRAKCACGQGFLRYYKICSSDDWGTISKSATPVELICNCCQSKYHYEYAHGDDYLVPNGLSFPKKKPRLDMKYNYNESESLVLKYTKSDIEAMVADMTAPKHRFIKNLENKAAIEFASEWVFRYRKKSLPPMVSHLQQVLYEFDKIKTNFEQKKPFVDTYDKECIDYDVSFTQVEEQSVRLKFQYDQDQDNMERERAKRNRERYEEEHRYDDFTAQVHYDLSYKKDFVNHYWDSYFIKECTDSQHLSLHKSKYSTPRITIAKKYVCVCQICGKETEILSSDLKISYSHDCGYYPEICCSCHTVSSFEAKTMYILNLLGITYMREKSFENLVGDSGRFLRFDFALSKLCDDSGIPIIDLVIELQGPHHYKKGYYDEFSTFITDDNDESIQKKVEDNFARQLRYDKKKKEYCQQQEIKLECIKYTESNDYERLEKKIIEILKEHGYKY